MSNPAHTSRISFVSRFVPALLACLMAFGCDEKGPDAFSPAVSSGETTGDLVVTVTANGSPLEGATVAITGPEDRTGTTDADGTATFADLSSGVYTVTAAGDGITCNPTTADVPAGGTATATISCTPTTGDLVVTVTANGSPLEGATVSITGPEGRTGTTDADGTATFADLASGVYTVTAAGDGITCNPTTADVPAGGTATAQVSCTSG